MNNKENFSQLFRKYRILSGFKTLSDFADALADKGQIFESSLFSHWQTGKRIPQDRRLVFIVLKIFIEKSAISQVDEANAFMNSTFQGFLSNEELRDLGLKKQKIFQVPKNISHVIHRKELEKKIRADILNNETVILIGQPGIGKTTLAIDLAYQLSEEFPDGVLWYQVNKTTEHEVLASIAHAFGENIWNIQSLDAKLNVVSGLLAHKKVLLCLDNVLSNQDFVQFCSRINAACIVTTNSSELYIDQNYKKYFLEVFNSDECLELYDKFFPHRKNNDEVEKFLTIAKRLDYLPISLRIAGKQIKETGNFSIEDIDDFLKNSSFYKAKYGDQTLWKSINTCFKNLDTELKNTLLLLSHHPGQDFDTRLVAFLENSSEINAQRKIERLVERSFLDYSLDNRYRIHLSIFHYLKMQSESDEYFSKIVRYYYKFLQKRGKGISRYYQEIENESENIRQVFLECYKKKMFREVIQLWEYWGVFLWSKGRWDIMLKLTKKAEKAAINISNTVALARLYTRDICWIYYWQGNVEKAYEAICLGLDLSQKSKNKEIIAQSQLRFGKILQFKKDLLQSKEMFFQALYYYDKQNDKEKRGDILTYIGESFALEGNLEEATNYLQQALLITNEINDIQQKAIVLTHLGAINCLSGNLTFSEDSFIESIRLEELSGRRVSGKLWNSLGLGVVMYLRGDHTKKRQYFDEAKLEQKYLGMKNIIYFSGVVSLVLANELTEAGFFDDIDVKKIDISVI